MRAIFGTFSQGFGLKTRGGTLETPRIQQFQQRLSKKSVKAYATIPKGSLGNAQ